MAETIKIVFKVDGKDITATEKDLKELQKATKKVQGGAKKTQVSMKGLGGAFGAVATAGLAAAAGILAFGKETLAAARETDNLAKRAGISVEAFQRQAFAAKQVGIEQDKLSDIYLDTNDKLGDFINTGAGPLVDFFDTVGKKVGVTIDDFKGLSGDQALGLYVDTLDKANVNQAELSFFMEAIASDSTALAPLLVNNAKAMKEMGEAAGNVLSQDQIDNAQEINKAFDSMASTVGNQLKGAFINAATAAGDFFGLLEGSLDRNKLDALHESASAMGESLNNLMDEGELDELSIGIAKSFGIPLKKIEGFWGDEFVPATEEAAQELQRQMAKAMQASIDEANGFKKVIEETAEAVATAGEVGDPTGAGTGLTTRIAEVEELSEIKVTAMKRELTFAEKLAAIEQEHVDWQKEQAEELEDLGVKWGVVTDFAAVHREDLKEIQLLLAKGKMTAEEYAAEILKLAEGDAEEEGGPFAGLVDELTSLEAKMKNMKSDAIVGMAEGIAEMAVSGEADFREMTVSMLKQIAKLLIQMAILKAVQAATGFGGASGAVGGIMPPGQATLVGEHGPEIVMPAAQSRIIPNHALGGGGGSGVTVGQINVVVKEQKGETSSEQAEKISKAVTRDLKQLVQGELRNQGRSGNMLNPANVTSFR